MIPRTFPSTFASNGQQQMVVHFLTSVEGLERWSDYIPVKLEQGGPENSYSGCIDVVAISELTADTQAWKEYIPVYADSSATDSWTVNTVGYIPYNYALFAEAAMQLDLTNGASLDPRVTFSRTTNATVTGPDGLIAYAPMNLLTFSEQFDNAAWLKTNVTVDANTTVAPNGTITADLMYEDTGNATKFCFQTQSFTSGTSYTLSVFAKYARGTNRYLRVLLPSGAFTSATFALFDLQAGNINAEVNTPSATITAVGNGWYRCSITKTATATAGATFQIGLEDDTIPGYTGDGFSGIFIWGAQLEISSTARAYNPTTVKNLLGFTEHFDNAAWTKSNSFVQTNLLLRSEEFENAYWSKTRSSVTANTIAAPDGTLTADKLIEDTAVGNLHYASSSTLTALNGVHTATVFAKFSERNLQIVALGGTTSRGCGFNLLTGEIFTESVGGPIQADLTCDMTFVGDGWWRCRMSWTADGQTQIWFLTSNGNTASYTGDGTSGIYLWGAQLVQGTTPGDYKATYAAPAAVGYTDIYGQPFAQKLVEDTANSTHSTRTASITLGFPVTFSCYMKANERSWGYLQLSGSGSYAFFDLNSGVVGATVGGTAEISSVGAGWYRCSLTDTTTTTAFAIIGVSNADNTLSYTGDGTSGIYIFGAQLSDSASVDPYVYQPVAAPTSTAYYGPRFDYDPVTLAPKGLLVEESRTNLLLRSEEFDSASWSKANATITANTAVAPDGTTSADTFNAVVSPSPYPSVFAVATVTQGIPHTLSIFAKTNTNNRLSLEFRGSTTSPNAVFNLDTGTIVSGSGAITSVGQGWYRCSITVTSVDTSEIAIIGMGDNFPTGSIFIWGASLEQGAFSTSYIPTSASQVTRAADSASMIGNNFARWYNVNEGTLFGDWLGKPDGQPVVLFQDTLNSIQLYQTSTTQAGGYVRTASVFVASLVGNAASDANVKGAIGYKTDDFAASFNGATAITDLSGNLPPVTSLRIGASPSGTTSFLNGTIKRISYYNRRLANSELIGITS